MTTKSEDIWICTECSTPQGRHDQWFTGDICEKCNEKMENKLPTAEEFFKEKGTLIINKKSSTYTNDVPIEYIIEFTKLHVEAALKKASEDAEISLGDNWVRKQETIHPDSLISSVTIKVDDESILNSYPLTNIK